MSLKNLSTAPPYTLGRNHVHYVYNKKTKLLARAYSWRKVWAYLMIDIGLYLIIDHIINRELDKLAPLLIGH